MKSLGRMALCVFSVTCLLLSPSFLSAQDNDTPSDKLLKGVYKSTNARHPILIISEKNGKLVISGVIKYNALEIPYGDAVVSHVAENRFTAPGGVISAIYNTGLTCEYPIRFTIKSFIDKFYIETNEPQDIPGRTQGFRCPQVQFVDRVYSYPFVKK